VAKFLVDLFFWMMDQVKLKRPKDIIRPKEK
jgi:hypothetical protein